jgi:hypothetical protein
LVAPSFVWKLALAVALAAAIIVSASAKAPRKPLPQAELRGLLAGALALYAVALVALLDHRSELAVLLFAAGIVTSTLAAWLSRGSDAGGGPPRGDEPVDEQPPPDPDGALGFDWAQFERDLLAYTDRLRDPVRTR